MSPPRQERAPGNRDDSAIFSLGVLAAQAATVPTPHASSEDDSGLIDLRALADGQARVRSHAQPPPLMVADLFPLAAPTSEAPHEPTARPKPSRRRGLGSERALAVVLGVTVLVLASIVVVLLTRPLAAPPPLASAAPPAAVSAAAEPRAIRSPPPAEVATVPGAAGSSAPTPGALPSGSRASAPGTTPVSPRGSSATKASAAGSPPTGSCPCPADDLLCHMHCRSGK